MKRDKQSVQPVRLQRQNTFWMLVRMFQVSGISLITMSILNMLFLPTIAWGIDGMFFVIGLGLLWSSYHLWRFRLQLQRQSVIRSL